MSTSTTNLNLIKPDVTELYDIGVFNGNADKIDAFAGAVTEMIAGKVDPSELAAVATSGAYSDLTGKPVIDAALDSTSTNAIQNAAVAVALALCMTLGLGKEIPSSVTKLADVTEPGVYRVLSGAPAQFTDLPSNWDGTALNLFVLPTTVEWRTRQILLPASPVSSAPVPHVWMRYKTGGTAANPGTAAYQKWVDFTGTTLTS